MNILTFDIEDWYNCDFLSQDFNWDKFEVRIYDSVDKILYELSSHNLSATFFCLGWLAERHPDIIRRIHSNGHQIGCHSYQHELSYRFDKEGFRADTLKAKQLIEHVIGEPITCFRAPGFSITEKNLWALEVISELGFIYDCSVFPAQHEYGGLPTFGEAEPVLIKLPNGNFIKEFPMSIKKIYGKKFVYSGGGFFRIFPYILIKHWASQANYLMTYFHPRDFDKNQPILNSLPIHRKIKSYIGLSKSFSKFQKLLIDFEFVSIAKADIKINWDEARIINLHELSEKSTD
jgi:polysaccharide deacetylase family protein (PEP-CTERM system associated)